MTISSRTPEGWDGHCRICGRRVRLEPSLPIGDATCPFCGSLLLLVPPSSERPRYTHASFNFKLVAFTSAIGGVMLLLILPLVPLGLGEVLLISFVALLLFGKMIPRLFRLLRCS